MDMTWILAGALGAFASFVAALCVSRPQVARHVCEYISTIAAPVGLIFGGGLASSIVAKMAVGALAAGMYAEDYAITDGAPGTDSNETGRHIVYQIASSVDPIIMINLYFVIAALLIYIICHAAKHFAQVVLDDDKPEH